MCSCRRASFERGAALFSVHRPSILQCLFLKSAGAPKSICCLTLQCGRYTPSSLRRRGRVAEGGGLLNRYTLQRRIEGSNPSVSAKIEKPGVESPLTRVPQKLICGAAAVCTGYRGLTTPVAENTPRGRNDSSVHSWLHHSWYAKPLK